MKPVPLPPSPLSQTGKELTDCFNGVLRRFKQYFSHTSTRLKGKNVHLFSNLKTNAKKKRLHKAINQK